MTEPRLYFTSLGYGALRMSAKHITKERLERLFQVTVAVVVDKDGDEVVPDGEGKYRGLSEDNKYMVISEEEIERMSSNDDAPPTPAPFNPDRMRAMNVQRLVMIQELYVPLHPHLFTLTEDMFLPSFINAINGFQSTKNKHVLLEILKLETPTGIYSFEIFTPTFCRQLLEEVENFENSGLPVTRPNSMNNYGMVLDDIGFGPFFSKLTEYIRIMATYLYPNDGGATLDSHHAFIVQYKITEDLDLDFHFDDSEVTINLCLGKDFTGGTLYFKGLLNDPMTHNEDFEFTHTVGKAIIHIGKHRHGANSIISGERYNLIVWFRSSEVRSHRPACQCGRHHSPPQQAQIQQQQQQQQQQIQQDAHDHHHHHDHGHGHSHSHGHHHH
eukprot:TRINITY_DN2981_c0_g1_i1.p1 TRINITY_DN2981_c0_g1~~TRINITY_DN2981_c0_g1_i1.p1  ORF type:complete len:385 (-),score=104.98 TRINITY_DN2981_c0_g1_i1:12-1166(-)